MINCQAEAITAVLLFTVVLNVAFIEHFSWEIIPQVKVPVFKVGNINLFQYSNGGF